MEISVCFSTEDILVFKLNTFQKYKEPVLVLTSSKSGLFYLKKYTFGSQFLRSGFFKCSLGAERLVQFILVLGTKSGLSPGSQLLFLLSLVL